MTDDALSAGEAARDPLRAQLLAMTAARLVLNTGHRMIYPFLPTFARALGVPLETVALAVTARAGLGLISPVFGVLGDRHGRRAAMLGGLGLFALGMLLVTSWASVAALFGALLLANVGKLLFDPSMQAYIGDRVDYRRRGLAIALTELAWSGAFLVSIPPLGWLIDRTGSWRAPFPVLAVLGVLAMFMLQRMIPSDWEGLGPRPSMLANLRTVLAHPVARAGLLLSLCFSAANETIGIIYGAWLEQDFNLKVTALGASAIVIGAAELIGEGGVAGFVDRVGKRRAIGLGVGLNALAALLLPALSGGPAAALAGLFFFYLTFEFGIVSALPLMTELVPHARATVMAGNVTAFSAGRMLGATLGPALFGMGLLANGVAAALLDGVALVLLVRYIHEQ